MNRRFFFVLFFIFTELTTFSVPLSTVKAIKIPVENLPQIEKLSYTDLMYRQLYEALKYNEKELSKDKDSELVEEFYTFCPGKYDDLLNISAATGIPYDTIATINRIADNSEEIAGRTIIIPTVKGIYMPLNPKSVVETLIYKENSHLVANSNFRCYNFNDNYFIFFPGSRFSSTQRAFFIDSSMGLPLDSIRVTSDFGYRTSPVYGKWKFHKGIDLGAAIGTPVYACKAGTVTTCIKNDNIFGNYIILTHSNGMTSVYAHLSEIKVSRGEIIQKGKVIGLAGETGAATGPHLHFEIRQNGQATDPAQMLHFQVP